VLIKFAGRLKRIQKDKKGVFMLSDQMIASMVSLQERLKFFLFSSIDEKGFPDTRVLFNLRNMRASVFKEKVALENVFATYISTNTSSSKVSQIQNNRRTCIYYSDNESFEGLTITGYTEEIHDRGIKRAIWDDSWDVYYLGGMDGGDYSILKFLPLKAKYYKNLQVTEVNCEEFGR